MNQNLKEAKKKQKRSFKWKIQAEKSGKILQIKIFLI